MPSTYARALRAWLRRLNRDLSPVTVPPEPFDRAAVERAAAAITALPVPSEGARLYLAKHVPRLARTLALVPPATSEPGATGRVLELGCYMQITPLLDRLCGYKEVRGAYYGPVGRVDKKELQLPDGPFTCEIDHFDAERDPFPYPDGHFDTVIAGEIIEHMTVDPMHLLVESNRVLREGGTIVVTTPNVGSITSVAKTLGGQDNPQIFYLYDRPRPGIPPEIGHVREYAAHELGETVKAAGFEVTKLFTTYIEEFAQHRHLLSLLEEHGYSTENRGEQSWCVGVKRGNVPIDRYPWFLYTQ